jgi:hypothetical protein
MRFSPVRIRKNRGEDPLGVFFGHLRTVKSLVLISKNPERGVHLLG